MRITTSFLLILLSLPTFAHNFEITRASLDVQADQKFQIQLTCDIDALALGVPLETEDAKLVAQIQAMTDAQRQELIAGLQNFFDRRFKVYVNDQRLPLKLTVPPNMDTQAEIPSYFGTTAYFSGTFPADTAEIQISSSRALPPVQLQVQHQGQNAGDPLLLERGGKSDPISITAPIKQSFAQVTWTYLVLGFEHILPLGLDHILFVLGLYLGCTRLKPLILQVSAFTLAHTMTLALATLEIVSLPSQPVEVLIALSIVYVGIENWRKTEIGNARIALVFAFGLLHGLGFAGVLGELGLPKDHFVPALLAFNIGVEFGQLAVIAIAFAAVGWLMKREDYRKKVVIPASLAISLVGAYWVVERIIG